MFGGFSYVLTVDWKQFAHNPPVVRAVSEDVEFV